MELLKQERQWSDRADVVKRLVDNGVVQQQDVGGTLFLRFNLDLVAEYLAVLYWLDDVFPADDLNLKYRTRRPRSNSQLGNAIEASREQATARFGAPMIRKVEVDDVSAIKAYLAAGWAVVVTTMLTDDFLGHGFREFGLPVTPMIGQQLTAFDNPAGFS